jgi:TolA-binding protein
MPSIQIAPRLFFILIFIAGFVFSGCSSMPWNQKTEDELALEQEFDKETTGQLEGSSADTKDESQFFDEQDKQPGQQEQGALTEEEKQFFGEDTTTQEITGQPSVEKGQAEEAQDSDLENFFGEEAPKQEERLGQIQDEASELTETGKAVMEEAPGTATMDSEEMAQGFDSIDQKTGVEEMKVDIQILQSQQEALIQRVKELQTVIQDMEPRLTAIQGRLETNLGVAAGQTQSLAPEIESLKQNINKLSDEISSLKGSGSMKQAKLAPRKSRKPTKKTTAYKTPSEYNKALKAYRDGSYDESIMLFQEYRLKNPPEDLKDNVIFWLGNNYYQLGRYDEAMSHFEMVLNQYPTGNKVHDSRFMMGVTLQKMGDTGRALDVLEKALQANPPSDVRKKIEAQLMEIQ